MRNRKAYEWMLTIVYIAMILLCVILNFTSGQKEGIANIAVNVLMFIVVGLIFLNCELHSFLPMNAIIADLEQAAARIKSDAMNAHEFLWEPYNTAKVQLFQNARLQQEFQDYLFELNRITDSKNAYYKCDIEDYINLDLVDGVMHRNLLNQVAGAMTGLGILGTFIGLSLGLQSFNTGTTAEITGSITPLMNGIKVAFHTSIYGMIFSLVFNYVYKRKLDDAENAIRDFLVAYKKYVLPDTTTDGINKLMELQQAQVRAIRDLTDRTAEHLTDLMNPQFDRLNETITSFGNLQTRTQMDAMSVVVEAFIQEMNRSLAGSFQQLKETIARNYENQQQNAALMQEVLKATGSSNGNLQEINRQTGRLIDTLNSYTGSIQAIQDEIGKNITGLSLQTESSQLLVRQEQKLLQSQDEMLRDLKNTVIELGRYVESSSQGMTEASDRTIEAVDNLRDAVQNITQKTRGRAF